MSKNDFPQKYMDKINVKQSSFKKRNMTVEATRY